MSDDNKPPPEPPYEVGYGKPPRHSRWRPGRSGNLRGRPRGTKNLATDLTEELAERVEVREGQRALTLSKQRLMLKANVARACKGDPRATALVMALIARLLEAETEAPLGLSGEDQDILAAFLERARVELKPASEPAATPPAAPGARKST